MVKPLMAFLATSHVNGAKRNHADGSSYPNAVYKALLASSDTQINTGTVVTKVSRETSDAS